MRKRPVHTVRVLVEKARVVEPRAERGENAPRIVVAVVHTRLIAERRAAQQGWSALDDRDALAKRAQHEREAGAIEAAANDYRVELGGPRGHPRRRCGGAGCNVYGVAGGRTEVTIPSDRYFTIPSIARRRIRETRRRGQPAILDATCGTRVRAREHNTLPKADRLEHAAASSTCASATSRPTIAPPGPGRE